MPMQQHYVRFFSPGTFFCEETVREIESWDVEKAVEMSHTVLERYNARPFAFVFTTNRREDNEMNSKEVKRSRKYHLGGEVETIEDVRRRNDPKERILLSNMECNGWKMIIHNNNSWKSTQPLEEGDVVLEYAPRPLPTEKAGDE